jgi:hypothetical protein
MADKKMPDVTGKGPALSREMLAIFKEIDGMNGLSGDSMAKIKAVCQGKGAEMEAMLGRAYMKTVKAGEVSWQCKELAVDLKDAIAAGNEAGALEILGKIETDLGSLIHTAKTFVIRMT